MTINKNVKNALILSIYTQDIDGVKISLNRLIKTRQAVYVTVNGYSNMFKNQGDREDAFLFFDVTEGESCVTIENADREIVMYFNSRELDEIVKAITSVISSGHVFYKGITNVYIDKKRYALLVCNMQCKRFRGFDDKEAKAMLKSEIGRLLEESV